MPSAFQLHFRAEQSYVVVASSRDLACALRLPLAHLPVLDFGELTLTEEDKQFLRTRIWCDARIDTAGGEPYDGAGNAPAPASMPRSPS